MDDNQESGKRVGFLALRIPLLVLLALVAMVVIGFVVL